jgi:ATP-dependent Clp protease ATP-binding subunit ClpA
VVPNGDHAKVTNVYPQGVKDVYKITFVDGRVAESCKEHLWTIYGKYGEEYRTKSNYRVRKIGHKDVTLEWIMNKMNSNKSLRIRIPVVNNLGNIADKQLPIDPWLMGFLLGDGSFASHSGSFSTGDVGILDLVSDRLDELYNITKLDGVYDYMISSKDNLRSSKFPKNIDGTKMKFKHLYRQKIYDLGLNKTTSYNKFIPDIYKSGSDQQKLDLIAGLVDSDGYVGGNGNLSISTSSKRMSLDIQEIIWSLGGIAKESEKHPKYTYKGEKKDGQVNYNIQIRYPDPQKLSKLTRKLNRLPKDYQYKNLKLAIKKIEYSRTVETQCIMVDHPLHQYVTDNYIVTHNTVIVEGLARRIIEKDVPEVLLNKVIWGLDIAGMVAGTRFRGDFEERMKQVLRALKSLPNAIAFIDEIHMIMGAGNGSGGGALDAANILKPALSRGEIYCIGSTTMEEYRKHFEKDRALIRRFQRLDIHEPSIEDSKRILRGIAKYYESYHDVTFELTALDMAVELTAKHMHDKFLPDKAIDVIDSAAAWQRIRPSDIRLKVITVDEIEAEVSKIAKLPPKAVKTSDIDKLANLDADLKEVVYGQDEALSNLVNSIYMSRSGLREEEKTLGNYLFSGPTGTGKTETCKQLAITLGIKLIRFDMSEYQEKHTVSRLIGAPPGYVGFGDGAAGSGLLTNEVDSNPHCVLLMDEIEKAHPDVFNIMLQVMDYGKLTNSNGKTINFRNVLIVYTTNLGSADMERESIGFAKGTSDRDDDVQAINKFFAPEFRNRLDAMVRFNKLTRDNMDKVLEKFIRQLNELAGKKSVKIIFNVAAKEWLITKGFDDKMGARPLAKVISTSVKMPLSKEILFGKLKNGGAVMVSVKDNKLDFDYLSAVITDQPALTIDSGNVLPQEVGV